MPDAAPEPLESWTRSLNEDDALALVDLARPGDAIEHFVEDAHTALPQASRKRRAETIRLALRTLIDTPEDDDTVIAGTVWLRLVRDGAPHARVELLWARYLYDHPWVNLAIEQVIAPALALADEPLSPRDADRIDLDAWTAFVDRNIRPDVGPASRPKTRQQLQRALARLGVLDIEDVRTGVTRARHARPAPVAFGWLITHEMRTARRFEMDLDDAAENSRAARLFQTAPAYARQCLEDAVARGLLRRGYLAGRARLHPGDL